jgi:hypothetical protein
MATSRYNGNETGGSVQEWKVAVWLMMRMETSASHRVMATSPYNGNKTGGSVLDWKMAVLSMMETSTLTGETQTTRLRHGSKYSKNRARAAAVNFNDYEVKNTLVQCGPRKRAAAVNSIYRLRG